MCWKGVFMLADTLAAHSIGGFKVGVGLATAQTKVPNITYALIKSIVYTVHYFNVLILCVVQRR